MKEILFITLSVLGSFLYTEPLSSNSKTNTETGQTSITSEEFACTLTISGYGNIEGVGRVPITLSATEATCDEAAAKLRPQIISMELRLYE